jgi:hypothetical protein
VIVAWLLADSCNPALKGCTPDNIHSALLVFAAFVGALIVIALIIVVIVVSVRRGNRSTRPTMVQTPPPGSMQAGTPGGPGWFSDPQRRYPWRFFDGRSWTDQVSTGSGDTSIDPRGP